MLSIRLTVALNHEEIKNDPPKIAKIKSVIDEYNWKGTNFSSEKDDWKKIEEDNRRTALTDSYYKRIYIYIYPAYVWKYNSWKTSYSFDDSSSKIIISISKRNNIKN